MKEYKIGEVAKLLGLTTQALRFYEQEGVAHPRKSESGTRYYSIEDLHMMLSFKKYRMAEFSVQDILEHLRSNTLQTLSRQLDTKSDELLARSEEMLRRAQMLRQFRHEVDEAAENMGILQTCMRPEVYMQTLSLNDLDELLPRERREMIAYIDALPATSIGFICDGAMKTPARFCMCATPEQARAWLLPLEHAELLEPVKCVSTFIWLPNPCKIEGPVQSAMDNAVRCGYVIDKKKAIWGRHVASEAHDGVPVPCGKVYIPIE